jgi:hypothetical protein
MEPTEANYVCFEIAFAEKFSSYSTFSYPLATPHLEAEEGLPLAKQIG